MFLYCKTLWIKAFEIDSKLIFSCHPLNIFTKIFFSWIKRSWKTVWEMLFTLDFSSLTLHLPLHWSVYCNLTVTSVMFTECIWARPTKLLIYCLSNISKSQFEFLVRVILPLLANKNLFSSSTSRFIFQQFSRNWKFLGTDRIT